MPRRQKCCSADEPIPLLESISLHSWQKLRFKRFPYKLLFDLAVLVLAVAVTVLSVSQTAPYANASSDVFENVFGLGGVGAIRIYSEKEFVDVASAFVDKYYNLSNLTLSRFFHLRENGQINKPEMLLTSYKYGLGQWNHQTGTYEVMGGSWI